MESSSIILIFIDPGFAAPSDAPGGRRLRLYIPLFQQGGVLFPYLLLELKEGVKVLAWLSGFKMSEVKVGMKTKLVARITTDGEPTYEFVPL